MPQTTANAMLDALAILTEPGQVVELRALGVSTPGYHRPHTVSGYFDDMEKLAEAAARLQTARGIYITLNRVNPALLARAVNRVRDVQDKEPLTSDADVTRRRWLPIDCDPVRPSGISATDAEHAAGLARAQEIREILGAAGWPDPIEGDGGNSGHLLYQIDMPNNDESRFLLQQCLQALAFRFDDEAVSVDQSNFNAGRIWKLYGTVARKGDDTSERPHRLSRLFEVPSVMIPVPVERLETLAQSIPQPEEPRQARGPGNGQPFDIDRWITEHGLAVIGPDGWGKGRRWIFRVCPWNAAHRDRSAYIVQHANGAISSGCHHNGCHGRDWYSLRDVVEPGWRERMGRGVQRESRQTSGISSTFTAQGSPEWPEPLPLPDPLPPVEPFEPTLLPEAFRPWIEDIAERMQCPPDYPAVSVMTGGAAVVGRCIGIRPKRRDDWLVVPNLWGAVIGPPAVLKTPAILEPLKPLHRLEYNAGRAYEQEVKAWEAAQVIAKEEEKVVSAEIRDALKEKNREKAQKLAAGLSEANEAAPTRRRYIVNDTTVEKLGELLNQNPRGLLLFRDELTGFLRTLDREGHENDRAFYLEAWNGTGRYTYDRIQRGTIEIEAACVSILGSIQPGPLGHYLRAALEGGVGDDGLIQRFQLLVWPDISSEWHNVDRWPDTPAKQTAYRVFQRLDQLTAADIDATCDEEIGGIPYLHFHDEAQELFTEWRTELEVRLRRDDEHPAILAHLGKYRSLVPSLALLIHLVDGRGNPVDVAAVQRACAWADYLESHARRVYRRGLAHDYVVAHALARKIRQRTVPDVFSLREVYRHHWANLSTPEEVSKAVDVLVDLHWLRRLREETGGRPTEKFVVNPRVWEGS
jgi:hypothetical protein